MCFFRVLLKKEIEKLNQFSHSQSRFPKPHLEKRKSLSDLLHMHINTGFWLPCSTCYCPSILLWLPSLDLQVTSSCPSSSETLPAWAKAAIFCHCCHQVIYCLQCRNRLVSANLQFYMANVSLPCSLEPYMSQSRQPSPQRMRENPPPSLGCCSVI